MKIITFLLLIIAVNCKGQAIDTIPVSKEGLATFRIEALPTYMGVIGSNFLVLHDARGDSTAQLSYIERGRWGSEKIAWMNADSSIVIKDTMAAIKEMLNYIHLKEKQLNETTNELIKLSTVYGKIQRNAYIIDKKKFDNVVKRIGKL